MIKFIFLMMLSFAVSADIQLTWDKPELREDGSHIAEVQNYNIYHYHENILLPIIEVGADLTTYLYSDNREGVHTFQIATVEGGREGGKSDPKSFYIPNSNTVKVELTLRVIE